MWLIPLVWGWFAVGTHHSRRQHVLDKLYNSARDINLSDDEKGVLTDNTPLRIRDPDPQRNFDGRNLTGLKTRSTILGFPIGGDELADGPFYNYARCWTWSELSRKTIQAFIDAERLRQMHRPDGNPSQSIPDRYQTDTQDSETTSPLTRVFRESVGTRGKHPNMRATWPRRVKAFGMACVLHGIFGWSAFMIDYMTPTIGIGCRAFICMTYSIVSLSSCVFLILASECSDAWSSQCERYQSRIERIPFESDHQWTDGSPSNYLAAGSVSLRLLGKTLAILNAVFIVFGCILEFVGLYESCFCKSTYFGLRERAYVSFLSTAESVQIARPYWYGGAGAAISAVLIICFGYFKRVPRAK